MAAGDEIDFFHLRLDPGGSPDLEVFDDLNNDGLVDILLARSRTLWIFLNRGGGISISPTPSLKINIPADALFMDVGCITGNSRKKPVFMSQKGVYVLRKGAERRGLRPLMIIPHESGFLPFSVKKMEFLDFLRDVTGDGIEDILIPELDHFAVYARAGKGPMKRWGTIPFRPRADLYTEILSDTGKLKEVVHIPILLAGTCKEGRVLVLYDGTWIALLAGEVNGRFEAIERRPLHPADSREGEEQSRSYFGKNVFFEDLEGKGFHALVIADNPKGRLVFYKGGERRRLLEEELTIRTNGWLLKPTFSDLNRDGRKDLILPSVEKISIFTLLRVFFTTRFDIRYMIFYNRGTPLFNLQPDVARSVSLPLSISVGQEGVQIKHSLIYTFEGDFNGDGINDFLLKCGPQKLGIFLGGEDGIFSRKPDRTIDYTPLPDCSSVVTRVFDINGDGRSDLFLHQSSMETNRDTYDLYISRDCE